MIALAARSTQVRLAVADHVRPADARSLRGIERLADDAGRGEEDLAGACSPPPCAAASPVSAVDSRPFLPVKALALPELTTSTRALPPAKIGAAQIDRRRRAFRPREDAGDRGALRRTTIASRSVRFLYLIPASAVAMRTPSMARHRDG